MAEFNTFEDFYKEFLAENFGSIFKNKDQMVAEFAQKQYFLVIAYLVKESKLSDAEKISVLITLFSYPQFFLNAPKQFWERLAETGESLFLVGKAFDYPTVVNNALAVFVLHPHCLQAFASRLGESVQYFVAGLGEVSHINFLNALRNKKLLSTFFQFLGPHIADYINGINYKFHDFFTYLNSNDAFDDVFRYILDNIIFIFEKKASSLSGSELLLSALCDALFRENKISLLCERRDRVYKFARAIRPMTELINRFAKILKWFYPSFNLAVLLREKIVDFMEGLGRNRELFLNELELKLKRSWMEEWTKYSPETEQKFKMKTTKGTATTQKCAYCKDEFSEKDEVFECDKCSSKQHKDCWESHDRCVSLHCTGKPKQL